MNEGVGNLPTSFYLGDMGDPFSPDRFNEERATYSVRGGDQPDLAAGVAAIRAAISHMRATPGVYRMVDGRGDVLYVGKARALRQRVINYTQTARLPQRLQRMVAQTRSMEIVTTGSEAEALLLEAQLIKRFRPPYNVLLRDDKSFPYILLRTDHDFPRLTKHRGARKAKGQYFGPFASAGSVNQTLNALQKLFLLRSCSDSYFANRSRPCLLHQIKRCSAPCVGRVTAEDYAELVADARAFLAGKSAETQNKLAAAMNDAAEGLDYELAARLRDRLKALTFIQGSQAVHAAGVIDADIFALARRGATVAIAGFFIRGGQNWGHRSFFPAHSADSSAAEIYTAFLAQFYTDNLPPRMILIDEMADDADLLREALSTQAGRKVELAVPQRGERLRMLQQSARNAHEALERRLAESSTSSKILREIADLFDMAEPPQRIEIYDNSHISGSNMVGAMVVAGPDGFQKSAYRKWNIKRGDTVAGDDFAMMREVFSRRFARALDEDPDRDSGNWPDLVLVDGGRGQMSAVCGVLAELGVDDLHIVGVSKGPDRNAGREHFHMADGREFSLPPGHAALFHIQRLRDEAHRFAIGAHRQKRAKALVTSPLDAIPGIGPTRKRALLLHFGTARAVRNASVEDLQRVRGVSAAVAQQIYDYYHG